MVLLLFKKVVRPSLLELLHGPKALVTLPILEATPSSQLFEAGLMESLIKLISKQNQCQYLFSFYLFCEKISVSKLYQKLFCKTFK